MFARFLSSVVSLLLVAVATITSAAGPKAYVGNFNDNTVSVIDTNAGQVVATVPVAAGPHGMATTPDGRLVYVASDGSSVVSVIDTSTDKVTSTIEVGKTPHGLAMTPDGRFMIACVYGEDRLAFVDTSNQSIVATVAVPKPHTIAVKPDGKLAYVASQEPGNFALIVVDLASRTVLRKVSLPKAPRDPEFSHDGKALYFTMGGTNAVQVLDPSSDKIMGEIPTGASPHIAALFRGAPFGTVVVQGPGEIQLFDPATNAPVRTVAVGKQPHWIAATADGRTVYVTNEGSNDVTVVELSSGQTKTIPVGSGPRKVVMQRVAMPLSSGGGKVSIVNFAFAPAEVIVRAGDAVTWTNDDGAPHGLAFADGAKGTGQLLPGASFSRTYPAAGTFDYVCAVHPYMAGKVTVRAP
jgi:YVTN family beta-propeller protein